MTENKSINQELNSFGYSLQNDFKLLRSKLEKCIFYYKKGKEKEQKEESNENIKINFEDIYEQCRWCVFRYLDKKSIEAFELIPDEDRFCCFRFLDNKNLKAFNLIPYEDRFRCYQFLEEKELNGRKAISYINEKDRHLVLNNE